MGGGGGPKAGLRGRSVNIITLPALDHEPSYEDILYYGKPFCSTWSVVVLIYIGKTVHL